MESSSGKTLKVVAVILGVVGVIGAIVLGVMVGNNTYIDGLGFGVFVGTALSSFLSALMLYGFGELIDNTASISYSNNDMNNRIKRLEKKLEDALAEKEAKQAAPAEVRPVKTAVAPRETVAAPQATAAAKYTAEIQPVYEDKLDDHIQKTIDSYEVLDTARDIFVKFCTVFRDDNGEDIVAMKEKLAELVENERISSESRNVDAISMLKGFYQNGCRVFAVDRSQPHISCPVCGKMQKNERKRCHNCGALFRD